MSNFRSKGQQRHFNEVSGTTVSVVYSNKFQEVRDNARLFLEVKRHRRGIHIRTQFSEIKGNRQSTLAYDLEVMTTSTQAF